MRGHFCFDRQPRRAATIAVVLLCGLLLGQANGQDFRVDGSSSLYPASAALAATLGERHPDLEIEVGFSGTAGGFELLCRGGAEVVGASRQPTVEEREECERNGIQFIGLAVAAGAVLPIVNAGSAWAICLTLEELADLWEADSTISRWSDLRADWPAESISLHAPGVGSGTTALWRERVLAGQPMRTDFFPNIDQAALTRAVSNDPHAISFVGRAHYLQSAGSVRAVEIDDGRSCIDPASLEYPATSRWPLKRALFLFVSAEAAETLPSVGEYVELFLSSEGRSVIAGLGFLGLAAEAYGQGLERYRARITGPLAVEGGGEGLLPSLPGH